MEDTSIEEDPIFKQLEVFTNEQNFLSTLVEWKPIWDILKRWETTSIGNQQVSAKPFRKFLKDERLLSFRIQIQIIEEYD